MDTDDDGNLMAETTLAAAKNCSVCPVCFEILMPPIYQCCNGHLICFNCVERVDKCVECRVPLSRSTKVRNIALEKILNNLRVDCTNKNEGCDVQLTIEWLKNHLQNCRFTPFNFCSNLLGRKNCTFKVNDSSIVAHLEVCHSAAKVHCDTFRLCLNVSKISVGENDFFFEPVVVTSTKVPLLIRSIVSSDGYFTLTGFTLTTNEEDVQSIRLRFRIASQSNNQRVSFEWSGCAQSYRNFHETNIINSFRISVDSLLELLRTIPQENTSIIIHVFVWETTALSQEDNNSVEEVHIFEQTQHPRNIPNSQRASSVTPGPLSQSGGGSQQLQNQASEDFLNLYYSPFEIDN